MLRESLHSFLVLSLLFLGECQAPPSSSGPPGGNAPEPTPRPPTQIPRETIPIKEARKLEGKTVRVSGTVTVQSGAFASSISSGFAIQDESAGIYVIDDAHSFQLGQRVTTTGTVGSENMQRHIKLEETTLLSGTETVTPKQVQTGKVGEAEAGYLISVEGRIIETMDDGRYGYKLFIDDGSGPYQVFINASTELTENAASWKPGDVIKVIGFAGRYNDAHEIMPRILTDIQKKH